MIRTTIYLPEQLKQRMEEYATRRQTTEAAVVRDAVERLLAADEDRSWVSDLAGLGRADDEPIAHRIHEALDESGFGSRRT